MTDDADTHWNYRATVERTEQGPVYAVREIYYGPDGGLSWTVEPCQPQGDTWVELLEDLARMTSGASDPRVLDITEEPAVWVDRRGNPL